MITAVITLTVDSKPVEVELKLPAVPLQGQFLVFSTSEFSGRCLIKDVGYEITESKSKRICKRLLINATAIATTPTPKRAQSLSQLRATAKKRSVRE